MSGHHRQYKYIGPQRLLKPETMQTSRTAIRQPKDVMQWMRGESDHPTEITATFIVDVSGQLWIASQHSEHVVCARGQHVLSAGEITFSVEDDDPVVTAITNQSTGYCPEPGSWQVVENALEQVGISHPGCFTTAYIFRRCPACGEKNIVKEGWYYCGVCDQALPDQWNFDQ